MDMTAKKRTYRILLAGARSPAISGSCMTMRELERVLQQDESVELGVFDLAGIRGTGITGVFRYASLLASLFKSALRADALFLFTIGSGLPWTLIPIWCISVLTRTALIVRCGGGTAHTHGGSLRRLLVRIALKRAVLYVVQTRMLCEDAHSVGISRAVAIPNGRDLRSAIPADHPYVGRWVLLGRLVPTKGVAEAVEAFRRMPELSLDLVGPVDPGQSGEDQGVDLAGLDPPPNVRWLGARDPDLIPALLADYDGMLFPSYYSTEGHPGVLIEAMAAGLPIVTTRHRAIPEVVDAECSFLVEPRDVDGIVESIRKIDSDPELRDRLRQGALARAKSFDWSELSRECTRQVLDAISGPPR
ncbi:MAG: glycosyltransferase family 4 protein [Planctomycetota bacterium]|nr:glycosyltransferase family 4 protein [Planctomycetota bacterium]